MTLSSIVPIMNTAPVDRTTRVRTAHPPSISLLSTAKASTYPSSGLTVMLIAVAGLSGIGCAPVSREDVPQGTTRAVATAGPAKPSPLVLKRVAASRPVLSGVGNTARTNVAAFVGWASSSLPGERESARESIHAASDNPDIANALADEAFRGQSLDHSRTLIVLSILGELRSAHGEGHLERFLWQPLPTDGTVIEGDVIEATKLAMLEAKAVNGLAYLRTASADAKVLRAVSDHPSIVVRAEAIAAYLWNHDNSVGARAEVLKHVRKGEEIYLDRVRREPGERASSFDAKVASFLEQHPEAVPPDPVRDTSPQPEKPAYTRASGPPPSI